MPAGDDPESVQGDGKFSDRCCPAERSIVRELWKMASEQRTDRRDPLGCDRSACYSGRVLWDSWRFIL